MGEEFPRDVPAGIPDEYRERAKKLQYQLVVLEAQLDSANFENKEAYRRKIDEKRKELERLERPNP